MSTWVGDRKPCSRCGRTIQLKRDPSGRYRPVDLEHHLVRQAPKGRLWMAMEDGALFRGESVEKARGPITACLRERQIDDPLVRVGRPVHRCRP